MSETVTVAVLTGTFTLVSGLLGVLVAHWFSGKQAEAMRREQRRQEVRVLIAEFVNAGRTLASSHELMVPIYRKAMSDPKFHIEWPETDTGRAQLENSMKVDRLVGELRLIVNDPVLLERIAKAFELKSDTGPMGELLESKSEEKALVGAFRHYKLTAAAFDAVEVRAAELLRGEILGPWFCRRGHLDLCCVQADHRRLMLTQGRHEIAEVSS
jgi:hypothetical protein